MHQLPELPYAYNALEPFLSEQALRLHHDRHHRAYVEGLNEAERRLNERRAANDLSGIRALCDALAFNYSGHLFHSIFWQCMSPSGGGLPSGAFAEQVEHDFESFAAFRAQLVTAANTVQDSGWAVLAWQPLGQQLVILQAEKHQDLAQWGVTPVLVIDVWEHAYYLDYRNDRSRYVEGFFDVVNWDCVGDMFNGA
ncbi:MAG: superoxide dismutase [Armatimonadota bacterium]